MKLDLLVIAAHPDDAELNCGGTIAAHVALGQKVGVVDLTRGELGTRGTPELRAQEAAAAADVLGLRVRTNLGLADGFFRNDEEHQRAVMRAVRRYRPDVVLTNAPADRHPDHGRASRLVADSCFLAGLRQVETTDEGAYQTAWRPRTVWHFVQDRYLKPDFVIDITPHWETKLAALRAFRSQFHDPDSQEPETYISSADFWHFVEARAREFGHAVGTTFGEGFVSERQVGVRDLTALL